MKQSVQLIKPEIVVKDNTRDFLWGIVQCKGAGDDTYPGSYYIVRINKNYDSIIRKSVTDYIPIFFDLDGQLPSSPVDVNSYLEFTLGKVVPIYHDAAKEGFFDIGLIEHHTERHYDESDKTWVNPDTFLTPIVFGKNIKPLQESTSGHMGGLDQTDIPITKKVGEDNGPGMIITENDIILETSSPRGPRLVLGEDKITFSAVGMVDTQSATRKQGLTSENPINHFLPETLVTFLGSKRSFPNPELIIKIGWRVGLFIKLLADAKKSWSEIDNA